MTEKRRLELENIINCRELGGYSGKYGTTAYRRFLRCSVPAVPTKNDIKALLDYGVTTIIDLRGNEESITTPTGFESIPGINYHHVSLFEINVANNEFVAMTLAESYEYIIDNYSQAIKKVLGIIADAPDGVVMYHCFFGKDRTGIMSMLLMHIAGLPLEDIIADYQLSYTYLLPYINTHRDTLWDVDASMHYSLPETIAEVINHINEKYGSVPEYLTHSGVETEIIEKIRKRFF